EIVMYHSAVNGDKTKYMGPPSAEIDKAWDDLYSFGVSKIRKSEADQLPVKTVRIPSDPEHYILQLDVFHQLHCLNMLRKIIHPEYYGHHLATGDDTQETADEHLSHCIEHLRQGIICHSDVSTIVWRWIPERNRTMGILDLPHQCRRFDRIQEWAKDPEHQLKFIEEFDQTVQPPDNL
ncbi:hypothetical protein L218DRAFT_879031, partial [Marasmius fiardii PR-910]